MTNLAIIYDVHCDTDRGRIGWAYYNRARALAANAPDDFDVTLYSTEEFRRETKDKSREFDVVFNLDYMMARCFSDLKKSRGCSWPLVSSFNKDSITKRAEYDLTRHRSDYVICNNEERFFAGGIHQRTCCISNGVDTDFWKPIVPIEKREEVLWCGSSTPKKKKHYQDIIVPVQEELNKIGIKCSFRPINHIDERVKTPAEQLEWYNTGKVVICASSSEGGGPSFLMEAAACGCIPVTTLCGSIPEWLEDGVNGFKTKRSVGHFAQRIKQIYDSPGLAQEISRAASSTMAKKHSYGRPGNRAKHFFDLFRSLSIGQIPEPFTYRNA